MNKYLKKILTMVICLLMAGTAMSFPAQAATADDYQVTVYFTGNEGLALRLAADEAGAAYAIIPEGTQLHIEEVSDGFGRVSYDGYYGWVKLQYTKIVGDYPVEQPATGWITPSVYEVYNTVGEGLELRSRPTTNSSTFGPMYDGTRFTAEAVNGNWAYGQCNGTYGWAYLDYLRFVAYASTQPDNNASAQPDNNGSTQPDNSESTQPDNNESTQPENSEDTSKDVTPGADLSDEQEAYLDILQNEEELILKYDYQNLNGTGSGVVTLCDIYGDEIPELLYVKAEPNEGVIDSFWPIYLHIVTFEDGYAREIYAGSIDKPKAAGGSVEYYLFQVDGEKTLHEFNKTSDDGGTENYYRYVDRGDGQLTRETLCRGSINWDDSINGYGITKAWINEEECSVYEYIVFAAYLENRISAVLMYNGQGQARVPHLENYTCPAMTYYDAILYLESPDTEDAVDTGSADDTGAAADEPEGQSGNDSGWQDVYYDFICNGKYWQEADIHEQGLSGGVQFALWDMSPQGSGGIPELIVNNNADGMASLYDIIYTVKDGELVRLGTTGGHCVAGYAGTNPEANGIFGSNLGSIYYFALDANGDLEEKTVKYMLMNSYNPDTGEYDYDVQNEYLDSVYTNSSVPLDFFFIEDINSRGWDAFCSSYR